MKKFGILAISVSICSAIFLTPLFSLAYTSPGKPQGFVNDFAGVLSSAEQTQLETILSNFQKQTGNEIVIAIVSSLGDETHETYAVKLFEDWKIGKKGVDNGLLILQAVSERKIKIEAGYGLEPYITDAKAFSVYRNILTPAFQKGEYARGYNEAVTAIIDTLNGQVDAIPTDNDKGFFLGDWLFLIIFIPIWLGSILARSKSWWLGGALGAISGIIIGFIFGFLFTGVIWLAVLTILGLIFDFFVSKAYSSSVKSGGHPPWWIGGGGFGGRGGGFGGFGGGGSGGGGGGGGY